MSAADTDSAGTGAGVGAAAATTPLPHPQVSQDLVPPLPLSVTDRERLGADHPQVVRRPDGDKRPAKQSSKVCRFFATKSGCRAGDACRYQHVVGVPPSKTKQPGTSKRSTDEVAPITPDIAKETPTTSTNTIESVRGPRVTAVRPPTTKPVPQAQKLNPRDFQISQVVRRFKPQREDASDGTTDLTFSLSPSDPDFAFDLVALQCKLNVPAGWPSADAKPSLRVQNPEIPRGFQINIERGFTTLFMPGKTLLALLNDLDRHLESFLGSEKAQTIKLVANRKKIEPVVETKVSTPQPVKPPLPIIPKPVWTGEQKSTAKEKRQTDIQQLEARMGRIAFFSASRDKTTFNVPFHYPKPGRLPVSLQAVKEIILTVPMVYNLEPCSIKLKGVAGMEANNVEAAFLKHVSEHRDMTLMAHINYLTQHLHEMAATLTANPESDSVGGEQINQLEETLEISPETEIDGVADEDRPHLVFLSRPPPEWNRKPKADGDESSSDSSLDFDSDTDIDEAEEEDDSSQDGGQDGGASIPANASAPSHLEKGISLSFPNLEMTGIELLEVRSLSITVKCDRCKSTFEFKNIKPHDQSANTTLIRTESCNKCASTLIVSYRAEPVHANSNKAGSLDLEGCTVQDMSPSMFLPTCSECSTTQPQPGTTAVRGDTALAVCRSCHKKMTFHIHEVKFLRVFQSSGNSRLQQTERKKKKKENLGITAGTELPSQGRCKHYSKSYRWFRFSCCQRVHACDRCHDAAEPHPNEHANRMICGWCSREQNYRPEDCGLCRRSLVRRTRGGGFWEGGKGTRDRVKMNRNDPRKYKRVGGASS